MCGLENWTMYMYFVSCSSVTPNSSYFSLQPLDFHSNPYFAQNPIFRFILHCCDALSQFHQECDWLMIFKVTLQLHCWCAVAISKDDFQPWSKSVTRVKLWWWGSWRWRHLVDGGQVKEFFLACSFLFSFQVAKERIRKGFFATGKNYLKWHK